MLMRDLRKVAGLDANEYALGTADPSERVTRELEHEPLLRIHHVSFSGGEREARRIEISRGNEPTVASGVRRGLDIVKGLARGADSVAIGRAYLFGLAAGGEKGVDKALSILSRDVYLAMGLLGCRTVAELKERSPDILLVNAMSARRQGGIFDRKKAGEVLQPCLQ